MFNDDQFFKYSPFCLWHFWGELRDAMGLIWIFHEKLRETNWLLLVNVSLVLGY